MEFYLDYSIATPLGFEWYRDLNENIHQIPDSVDLIGLAFFYHDIDKIQPIVDLALKKSRRVLIYFCEFNGSGVAEFERTYHESHPNLQIFANAVPNYPSRLKHVGEWFMQLNNPYNTESWAVRLLQQLNQVDKKPFKFDCLLGRSTPARDFVSDRYHGCNQREDFIFSYYKDNLKDGIWNGIDLGDANYSGQWTSFQNKFVSISSILPVEIYNQSYYSIISDTPCPSEFTFYTEKIAKPMIAGRLFVAFGSQRYLENLRKIGFKTFHGIIDESYDQIADDQDRWNAAWHQVEFLLGQDSELIKQKSQAIIQHNRNLMLTTDWAAPIKQHVNEILFPKIRYQGIS